MTDALPLRPCNSRKRTRTRAKADRWEYFRAIHSRTLLMKHDVIQAALFLHPGRHTHAVGNRCGDSFQLPTLHQERHEGPQRRQATDPDMCLFSAAVNQFQVALQEASSCAVRVQLRAMPGPLQQAKADLTALGRGLRIIAVSLLAASEAAGLASTRFQAMVRALDLKTPKYKLQ